MEFLRKWKAEYKHKRLKSVDLTLDCDNLGINSNVPNKSDSTSYIDFCSTSNILEKNVINLSTNQILKYMGCTNIEETSSEKHVADAIKIVKSNRTKKNVQRKVNVNVMPDEIEVIEVDTCEIILHLSIYDISYCSAQHDVFALVASGKCSSNDREKLLCYVFQCPKREIAKETTMAVARSFGYAYQKWRQNVVEKNHNKALSQQENNNHNVDLSQLNDTIEDNGPITHSETVNRVYKAEGRNWVIFD